jgi:hypothetical protein
MKNKNTKPKPKRKPRTKAKIEVVEMADSEVDVHYRACNLWGRVALAWLFVKKASASLYKGEVVV